LTNDELKRCDVIVNIPSSPDYPTLNISQSVGIILYELFDLDNEGDTEIPSREEMAHLDEHILRVLNEIEFPRFNREKTALMLKRILEASGAGRKEIRSIRGILSAVEKKINKFIKNENV
jgi:rRNA methylase